MLLKFLPFSLKKEKSQVQSPQQKLQKNLQSEKQNEAFETVGLNLLSDKSNNPRVGRERLVPENPDSLTHLFKKIIRSICLLMILVIILNVVVLFGINYLKSKQNDLVGQVRAYADIEKSALSIDKKTAYYKKIVTQRESISPKVEFIAGSISSDTNIKGVKYTPTSFTLFADGPDAYTFTKLIADILKGDIVSEVSIKGARLNTRVGRFEIDMEGKFK